MSRIIKVFSTTLENPISITTDATTWGQFKDELENHDVNLSNLRATGKTSKVDYDRDDAILQNVDATIYLHPRKSESGVSKWEALFNKYTSNVARNIIAKHYKGKQAGAYEAAIKELKKIGYSVNINTISKKKSVVKSASKTKKSCYSSVSKEKEEFNRFLRGY